MSKAETLITDHIDTWTSAIKAKSSAGRGSGKKQEFYGTKKLRELILELAVRGLVVPQNPNDEPVTELLKRIAKEQNRLIREGVVTKQKSPNLVSEKETPFKLPKGWHWIRLSEIAYPQAGFAFKSKDFNESQQGLPLVRIRDVGQPFTGTYYDGEFREEFIINNGDYLTSMDGNFRVAPWTLGEALLNQRVTRLIFYGDELPQKFCAISLQLRLSELQGVKAYTTVDHLSGGQIANSVVALPPLAEQHRIVAKVDELMALCDQLEQQQEDSVRTHASLVETLLGALTAASERGAFAEAWQRIASHFDTLFTTESSIDQLKQTILQLAVMGKLVEQDPEDESIKNTLERITKAKTALQKSGEIPKEKPLHPLATDALPFQVPKTWSWIKLATITELITKGSSPKWQGVSYVSENEGVLFITSENVGNYDLRKLDELKYVEAKFNEIEPRSILQYGDILMNLVGASIGRTAIYGLRESANINQAVALIRLVRNVDGISPRFLLHYFNSPTAIAHMLSSRVINAQPNISLTDARNFAIPLPPLAEQHRIVAKVDELMALCDRLKARLQSAEATQLHLADTLVEAAIH